MRWVHDVRPAAIFTSPLRGEVGSRLRDPGEGGPPSHGWPGTPSPGMHAQSAYAPTSPLRGEVKSGCVNLMAKG